MFIRRSPHVLIQAVIAFTCGIVCSAYFTAAPTFLFPVFSFLALAIFLCWRFKSALQLPMLLLFWVVCGLLHGVFLQPPKDPESLYRLFATEREATLSGTLLQAPAVAADKTHLLMEADAYLAPQQNAVSNPHHVDSSPSAQSPSFLPAWGRIKLTLPGPAPEELIPGRRLLVRAHVARPRPLSTPGGFDYEKFLAAKDIQVTGWISSPAHITTVSADTDRSLPYKIRFFPEQLRHGINQFLTDHLPPAQSSIYKAILTGDQAAISPQTLENYRTTGAMHILAISGLHMGLIAVGFGAVINRIIKRSTWLLTHTSGWKTAVLLIIPILFGYAFIAGLQTPVLRALISSLVFLLAVFFDRQWHIPTNIAIAAFIILLINPAALFTVSFQLSFAAVIAMAAIMPVFTGRSGQTDAAKQESAPSLPVKTVTVVKTGFFLSMAAFAGTLPLLVFHFNRFSPLSAISTLLLEPLLCFWALPLGLVSIPFIYCAPQIAGFLLDIGAVGITIADSLCARMAALPFSSIWLPTPFIPEIICYYILLAGILFMRKSKTAKLAASFSALALVLINVAGYAMPHNNADTVSFLDVGQGNAVAIQLDGGYSVLIDGGGAVSPQFNVGEKIIAPFLWSRRIRRLDAVVISHPDADHFNGLAFIIKRFRPKLVWVNGDNPDNNNYTALLRLAEEQGAAIHIPRQDETLFSTRYSRLYNIGDIHLNKEKSTENDRSLTLRLSSHGKNFLFTGDIEKYAEEKMVNEQKQLAAEILLLPHHGSNSSTSRMFLAAVKPAYAIVSAGRGKSSFFPAPDVVSRCRHAGCLVYNTAHDGAIIFTVEGNGSLSVETTLSTHR